MSLSLIGTPLSDKRPDYVILALGLMDAAGAGLLWLVAPASWSTPAFALYVGAPAFASLVTVALSAWTILGDRSAGSTGAHSND
jgi:hypothetical protein